MLLPLWSCDLLWHTTEYTATRLLQNALVVRIIKSRCSKTGLLLAGKAMHSLRLSHCKDKKRENGQSASVAVVSETVVLPLATGEVL